MEELLIFPCNGNAVEALGCIGTTYQLIGFVDDNIEKQGLCVHEVPVFSREALTRYPKAKVLAVPGSPVNFKRRREIISSLNLPNERFATIIHPRAYVSGLSTMGCNILLMAGTVITSNAGIGSHVCILPNTVVHHDSTIGDYTLIGSNVTIAGSVRIGENCYVGSGSSIINGIEIGEMSLIGLGSNVIRTLPAFSKAVGNPARQIGQI